ncbi:DUF317 domain-containing protein [Streptomyces sp. NPDC058542]|uniref:DUF317 domain-containing protein n=1 Tax=Streptomyces sp. NPDC058542 TaxID=3346543 RepID=UPI00364D642F
MLEQLLAENSSWEKHHQWPGEATYALHESHVLRVGLYHHPSAGPRDELWTVAAYESPADDRLWHATRDRRHPEGIITTLLRSLADEHNWGSTTWAASTAPPGRKAVLPRADYGWEETTTESGPVWTSPERKVPPPARPARDVDSSRRQRTAPSERDHAAVSARPTRGHSELVFELAEGQGPRQSGTPRAPRSSTPCQGPTVGPPTAGSHTLTPRSR